MEKMYLRSLTHIVDFSRNFGEISSWKYFPDFWTWEKKNSKSKISEFFKLQNHFEIWSHVLIFFWDLNVRNHNSKNLKKKPVTSFPQNLSDFSCYILCLTQSSPSQMMSAAGIKDFFLRVYFATTFLGEFFC